ncbi:MAG: adenosylcobinamide-phosphate synthase CbiB [Actinomycetota bacterium]|nr:adenosylcobinamide-phosphate synthase CbiB [Actinomycetota bacterium]
MITLLHRPAAIAVGLAADLVLGEPPLRPHPVAAFGTLMNHVEARIGGPSRLRGAVHAAIGLAVGATAGSLVRSTTLATYVAVAPKGLVDAAGEVGRALTDGSLEDARRFVPALVSRDPDELDEAGLARAAVESVAENTVDAVVAPVFWALAGGAPGVAAHRALNTLDAMVGYRTERHERYGWASARLDDAAAWLPARATAVLVAAARPHRAAAVWRAVRDDAPAHPSPNGGVAEAAFAAALGLRLGGPTTYHGALEIRPTLGDGRPPEPADVARASRLLRDVTLLLIAALVTVERTRQRIAASEHPPDRDVPAHPTVTSPTHPTVTSPPARPSLPPPTRP